LVEEGEEKEDNVIFSHFLAEALESSDDGRGRRKER